MIFINFEQFSEALGPPKIDPKSLKSTKYHTKIDVQKNQILQHYVFSIFRRFGLPKRIQNPDLVELFRQIRFGENAYKTLAVRRKIKVQTIKNRQKNDSTTRSKKAKTKLFQTFFRKIGR